MSRDALISSGTKIFATKGLFGATTREIANGANCNVSMISHYFKSKNGLYQACLIAAGNRFIEIVDVSLTRPATQAEYIVRLQLLAEKLLDGMSQHPEAYQIVMRELGQLSPVFQEMAEKYFGNVYNKITDFFSYAQSQGWLNKSLEPRVMANFFHGILSHQILGEPTKKLLTGRSIHCEDERQLIIKQMTFLFSGEK